MSTAQDAILAVNSGSSTIKFALYPVSGRQVAGALLSGLLEGLEPGGAPRICLQNHQPPQRYVLPAAERGGQDSFGAALAYLRDLLQRHSAGIRIVAVAHRIVHGGERYANSIVIDQDALAYLRSLNPLAPLHQPHNLDGVMAFRRAYPEVPQIACFDTGFHAGLPQVEQLLALPQTLRDRGIRRYGFHGLSYRYVAARLAEQSPRAGQRVIMAHLGNGASACAMRNGKSVATSMGFSALDGLMMGTRCGALDPGVLLHLLRQGWDVQRLEQTLYQESGLLGVSGISADMRRLRASDQPQAAVAIDLFTHRLIRECGALTACAGGIDALAFTGGIGEHDAVLRQRTCEALAYLGLRIDAVQNENARGDRIAAIHGADSAVEIWVVPTDEGRIAAADAAAILRANDA